MFSVTVEYALRAAVYLASKYDAPATTEEVAERTRVPAAYLAKILRGLTRAGLVKSQRGVGGGVTLARPPAAVSVLEVLTAVEPIRGERPAGGAPGPAVLARLSACLEAAVGQMEATLADTTLASLLPPAEKPGRVAAAPIPFAAPTAAEAVSRRALEASAG